MQLELGITETILIGIFMGAFAIWAGKVTANIEGGKPNGSGLYFGEVTINLLFTKVKRSGFHIETGILALLLMAFPFVIIALTNNLAAAILGIILKAVALRGILLAISMLILVMMFQGIVWHIVNPDPKYGVRKISENYPGMWLTIAGMTVASVFLAALCGRYGEWLIIYAIMVAMTVVLAKWKMGKEKIGWGTY